MLLGTLSSLAITLLRKRGRERAGSFEYFKCVLAVCVLCLFFMLPWVGLQSATVAFPGHTHLLFQLWLNFSGEVF